ncbi:zinc finger protein Xfin-like [Uloborus diversus]|uniref:zinc finger protein Xfin-like n=1 Tax=Uloborus diversus TaxID=327109 RepID=UPI00240A3FF5|nr:zinc finger protein Xfin-like [Uloborus diversus]
MKTDLVQRGNIDSLNCMKTMSTQSEHAFGGVAFGGFPFSNEYLLRHGNFFVKPSLHPEGFVFPALTEQERSLVYRDRCVAEDRPLDFAKVKLEKPTTPPVSPVPSMDETQIINGHSKNSTWILGKQKLSWDNSTVASYNPETKMFRCVVCNAVGFLSRIAEHYLGTHTSAKVFQCLHCPYSSTWSRCVRMHMAKHHGVPNAPPSLWKGQPLLEEIFQLLTHLKTTVDSQGRERLDPEVCEKKFVCPKCPYTTDRRDLYVRHENIHKEDKPYHCYVCFKLFNRADHVKKHFLRIHRGHPYDISLVRRRPPRCSSSASTNFSVDKLLSTSPDEKLCKSGSPSPVGKMISTSKMDLLLKENGVSCRDNLAASPEDKQDYQGPEDVIDLSSKKADSNERKAFKCSYCPWEGIDGWCLRRHLNVHLKNYQCPLCEFKAGKDERLFTHVYKTHRKLVCTKCKYITDHAQEFEAHMKDCCIDILAGNQSDKNSEDSGHNESDEADFKSSPKIDVPSSDFQFDPPLDVKGSVSLLPLHNSISYCFPGAPIPPYLGINGFNELKGTPVESMPSVSEKLPSSHCKVEFKPELASPVQSSSDSGVADITSDNIDQDFTCWHCGCEFANMDSLKIHTEIYHREDQGEHKKSEHPAKRKKFCCAICNFNSDKQRTIMEHMRFHTGEVLSCRACAFTTVCDSTLEKHVETNHADNSNRCPHCAFLSTDKVTFIRHYRKCHHSKSCSRCREIKHRLDKTKNGQMLPSVLEAPSQGLIRPYLHHNPYSRKASSIVPYSHCNAAMSKVAVAIPQSLQSAVIESLSSSQLSHEHKSRKQSTPRKLFQLPKVSTTNPASAIKTSGVSLNSRFCDIIKNVRQRKVKRPFAEKYRRIMLKRCTNISVKSCRIGHTNSLLFNNNINFIRHLYWCHFARRHRCFKCGIRFQHVYQVLLHRRRYHEG